MNFKRPFSDEQRDMLHEVIREGRTYLDEPRFTFTSQGAYIKDPGFVDLTLDSFFETDDLNDFRCLDTFCDCVVRFDYYGFDTFEKLFELMKDRVSFDIKFHEGPNIVQVFIPYEGMEEPKCMYLVYHPALYMFLKLYTDGHINIKVTSDELLEKICDFTGYVEEIV